MDQFVEYETPLCCMRRLTRKDISDEFKFILKFMKLNQKEEIIRTTVNKARLISKRVNDIVEIDPTINEYVVEVINCENNQNDQIDEQQCNNIVHIFKNILKSTEEKISIPAQQEDLMKKIRFLLGETSEDELHIEMKSIEESISYLSTSQHDHSIKFLSSKMKDIIENNKFSNLEEKIANEIIDSYFNNARNENEFEEIFNKLKEKENEKIVMHFLLQIEYSKLTKEMREYISDNLTDEIVNNELGQIINMFRSQLLIFEENKNEGIPLLFHQNQEFNGIIKYLLNQSGNEINKFINIKTSSVENNQNIPSNVLLFDDHYKYFATDNIKNSWICFEFKEHKIIPYNYTLRSYQYNSGNCQPKTWVIEGSNDENDWEIIDEQKNSDVLNGISISHTFNIQNSQKKSYQYIRMRETGSNWNNNYYLCFDSIEFYGYLK